MRKNAVKNNSTTLNLFLFYSFIQPQDQGCCYHCFKCFQKNISLILGFRDNIIHTFHGFFRCFFFSTLYKACSTTNYLLTCCLYTRQLSATILAAATRGPVSSRPSSSGLTDAREEEGGEVNVKIAAEFCPRLSLQDCNLVSNLLTLQVLATSYT